MVLLVAIGSVANPIIALIINYDSTLSNFPVSVIFLLPKSVNKIGH